MERFRVYIGDGLTPLGVNQSNLSESNIRFNPLPGLGVPFGGSLPDPGIRLGDITYRSFETGRVGGDFGNPFEPGVFEVEVDVATGREYHFFVVALSAAGDRSERSNIEAFTWGPPVVEPLPEIPWPARALPPVDANFLPQMAAYHLTNSGVRFDGVGIRVGDVFIDGESSAFFGGIFTADGIFFDTPTSFPENENLSYTLYTTLSGETIFPCVVYRYEVEAFSNTPVTGNIVQVTPLLTGLLEQTENGQVTLYNPFIDFYWQVVQVGMIEVGSVGVFIKDTHPLVAGRSYRYLIARFRDDGEIDRIVPTNRVTIQDIP